MPSENQNPPSDQNPQVPGEPNPSDQNQQQTPTPPSAPPPANDNISLSKQEYAQLVTQLGFLQNQLDEQIRNEQQRDQKPPFDGRDIDQLTNRELLELISRGQEQFQQSIINQFMQIAVKEEIRDLGDRYEDFRKDKNLRDEVLKVAEKNTQLSLEQAYLILKGAKPPAAPAPPTPTPPPSQRTEVAPQAVQGARPMSVREAAEAAAKSLKYDI